MAGTGVGEHKLQEAVAGHFERRGFVVLREVQFFTKRIDLFAVNRSSLVTVAIEAKVHNWKRALEQARASLLCADYVYVALPVPLAFGKVVEDAGKGQVGVLGIEVAGDSPREWDVVVTSPARLSTIRKEQYLDRMRGITLFSKFEMGRVSENAN